MTKIYAPHSIPSPEKVAKWVEELRSEEREQGTGHLRQGDKYCCLGVYCEFVAEITPQVSLPNEIFEFNGAREFLPDSVAEDFGWNDNPSVYIDGVRHPLSELNDSGMTFSQIADIIEYAYR